MYGENAAMEPVCGNVVILYGREAVRRLEELGRTWLPLQGSAWNRHFFLAVCDKGETLPALDGELTKRMNPNFFRATYEELDEESFRSGLHAEMFRRAERGQVLLQSVCFADEKGLDTAPLSRLCRAFDGDPVLSSVSWIHYMVLTVNRTAGPAQRAAADPIAEGKPDFLYLLSDMDKQNNRVKHEHLRHALWTEMLLNTCGRRQLERSCCYTLSSAAVNAGGNELDKIRMQEVVTALKEEMDKTTTRQDLAALFYGSGAGNVGGWLEARVKALIPAPDERIFRNARILCGAGQRTLPVEYREAALDLCSGCAGGLEGILARAKTFASDRAEAALETLRVRPASAGLRFQEIDAAIALLDEFADAVSLRKPEWIGRPEWPTERREPGRFTLLGAAAKWREYVEESCRDIERACEAHVRRTAKAFFAAALREALTERIRPFAQNAAGAYAVLRQGLEEEIGKLQTKYPEYTERVRKAAYDFRGQITIRPEEPIYGPDGTPDETAFRTMLEESNARLNGRLPAEFSGSFYRILNQECQSDASMLQAFFDKYLSTSEPMFQDNGAAAAMQDCYIADRALSDNEWFRQKTNAIFAGTDNMERFTCHAVQGSLSDFLASDDGAYFGRGGERGKGLVIGGLEEKSDRGQGETDAPSYEIPPVRPEPDGQDAALTRGLHTERAGNGHYLLLWDWTKDAPNLLVTVRTPGGDLVKRFPVQYADYLKDGGMDLTAVLTRDPPRGALRVRLETSKDHRLYGEATVNGSYQAVLYETRQTGEGMQLCLHTNNAQAVRGMMLEEVRRDARTGRAQRIWYPMRCSRSGQDGITYSGLQFVGSDEIRLRSDPRNRYPGYVPVPKK